MDHVQNILYTGGATGADKEWIDAASKKGHHIKIYRFDGVNHTRIENIEPLNSVPTSIITIENKDYEHDCIVATQIASEHMKVPVPSDNYTKNLINRDYYLIKEPSSLYAIGTFCTKGRLRINGHTAWIVEMFVDECIYKGVKHSSLPVYFMCQDVGKWYQLYYENMRFNWVHIKKPEEPSGNYIGIGSRELSMNGKLEIMYL